MNSHAAASTSRHGVGTAITSPNPSGSRKTTSLNNNVKRGFDPTSSNDRDIPCVEERVAESLSVWAKELRALFDHAKERFGDVTWENEDDSSGRSRIWGHKAVIYARAPKAFKDRYFISRPFSRSPASLRSPSPSFPSQFPDTPSSPHPSSATNSFHRPSPVPAHSGRTSTLSVNTIKSEGTLRANGDGVLRLTHGDTPELFQAQLEWLYTGEGFGDVVEWISAEDDSGIGGSIRDSLGRRGNLTERRDKLGQDLTYMWRSKLYADARIHLAPPLPGQEDSSSSDSDDSSDSLSSTAVFTAHRFILASRSPYFASVLLNGSTFKPHTSDIHLPTPPFTPAALHFCLGYIYAGHLDFSNRTFDLITAFAIHRAASYLQLDTLQAEIESRIAHEFCHAFDPAKVHCRRCPARIARVWRFASSPDVGSVDLLMKSRAYVVRRWGDTWGRDVALAEPQDRQALVKDVVTSIGPRNIVAAFRSLGMIQDRIDHAVRSKGRAWTAWAEPIEEMLQVIQKHVQTILVDRFAEVAESPEFWHLVSGQGFSHDLLETISKALVESVGTAQECVEGPRIYQALVSSLLLRVEPNTLQTALPPRSRGRLQIEEAKEGILGHVRRRWMQIRDGGGFDGLENWSLKEISDEIEVPIEDLLAGQPFTPAKVPRLPPTTGGRLPIPKSHLPRAGPSIPASEAKSVRSLSARSTASPVGGPSSIRRSSPSTPEKSGLRHLRLSSAASTNSASSTPSAVATPSRRPAIQMLGPQARSPTAALRGHTVSVGSAARRAVQSASPEGSARPSPRTLAKPMSGPPKALVTRGSVSNAKDSDTKSLAPSLASQRTTRTSKSTATITKPTDGSHSKPGPSQSKTTPRRAKPDKPVRTVPTPKSARKVEEESRIRKLSTASTASTRGKAFRKGESPPPLPLPVPHPADSKVSGPRPSGVSVASTRSRVPAPSIAPSIRSTAPSVKSIAAAFDNRSKPGTTIPTRAPARPSIPPKSPSRPPLAKQSRLDPSMMPKSRQPPLIPDSRTRTTSLNSNASQRALPKNGDSLAPALPIGTARPTMRSASSSTDGTEARTPRLSEDVMPSIEPLIRRDGSDASDLISRGPPSSTHSSPTKLPRFTASKSSPSKSSVISPSLHSPTSQSNLPPPVSMARAGRKISTSSAKSNQSYRAHPASAFDPPRRPLIVNLPEKQAPEGTTPFQGRGVALRMGIPCIVSLKSKRARFRAMVKYIGHIQDSRGPWLGIETEELDRFNVSTLDSGSLDGIHYFHLSSQEGNMEDVDVRLARQRRIEVIREGLERPVGLGLGTIGRHRAAGLPAPGTFGLGVDNLGTKRSKSPTPFTDGFGTIVNPRVLFVRPSEVVFVLGAE